MPPTVKRFQSVIPARRASLCHPGQAKREPGSTCVFGKVPCLRSGISCRGAHGTTTGDELFKTGPV